MSPEIPGPLPGSDRSARAGNRVRRHGRRAGLFAFIGIFNTLTDLAVYAGLIMVGIGPFLANGAGFVVANLQSYLVNGAITFSEAGKPAARSLRGYGRFMSAHLLGLAISMLAIFLLTPHIGPYLAKIAATGLTFCSNYILSARFVFRPQKP